MDLALTEQQEMLRRTGRDLLSKRCPKSLVKSLEHDDRGFSPELWREMAELGWMGLVFPEGYGGGGMSFLDLAFLLEETGRACLPGPFLYSILCGLGIQDAGSEGQKQEYLPRIASGEIFTLDLSGLAGRTAVSAGPSVQRDGGDYILNGRCLFVPYAHIADYVVCIAHKVGPSRGGGAATALIVARKSRGITTTVLESIADDKLCEVVFEEVRVPEDNVVGRDGLAQAFLPRLLEKAAAAKCCEMVGGMQQVLDMTVDYARTRKQFDRAIGSFQIIQHYCANMATDVDGSRLITYQAVAIISEGLPCAREVAMAKAWTGDAYARVVFKAHQIHGAIGMTQDYDLQYYTRRAKAAELVFGDARVHRETLASSMLARAGH